MPIFEYRCVKCGAQFEKLVFHASESTECPSCGSPEAEKLLSAFAVGGGSLKTDEGGPCGACGAYRRGVCGE